VNRLNRRVNRVKNRQVNRRVNRLVLVRVVDFVGRFWFGWSGWRTVAAGWAGSCTRTSTDRTVNRNRTEPFEPSPEPHPNRLNRQPNRTRTA